MKWSDTREEKIKALKRFYIPPDRVHKKQPEITGSDAGHIYRVLRLTAGAEVELFDGTGVGYLAQLVTVSPNCIQFRITESFSLHSESPVKITLAQGFLKDRKMDELVRPLTELGIYRWMPFYASRSVPVPVEKRIRKRLDRWEKINLEAVKQCRRGRVLRIEPAKQLADVLSASKHADLKVIFYEAKPKGFHIQKTRSKKPESIMVMIGPEGGFDPEEVKMAQANGFISAGMGPRILRAQTAAIAACTLVQYLFGDMGKSK